MGDPVSRCCFVKVTGFVLDLTRLDRKRHWGTFLDSHPCQTTIGEMAFGVTPGLGRGVFPERHVEVDVHRRGSQPTRFNGTVFGRMEMAPSWPISLKSNVQCCSMKAGAFHTASKCTGPGYREAALIRSSSARSTLARLHCSINEDFTDGQSSISRPFTQSGDSESDASGLCRHGRVRVASRTRQASNGLVSALLLFLSTLLGSGAVQASTSLTTSTMTALGSQMLHSFTSGYASSLALVFLSEVGDKTFFITALLAMKYHRTSVLIGAITALSLMTMISVVLGQIFHALPPLITSNIPFDDWAACALLIFFGLSSIREGLKPRRNRAISKTTADQSTNSDGAASSPTGVAETRMMSGRFREDDDCPEEVEAEVLIREREAQVGRGRTRNLGESQTESSETAKGHPRLSQAGAALAAIAMPLASHAQLTAAVEAFTLVFLAEWGDRSMLATIALSAAKNPFGVTAGAISGHLVASLLAILGGSVLGRYFSERVVAMLSGGFFIIFAIMTLFGVF